MTWLGTNTTAAPSATSANGTVTRNTEPHSNDFSRAPDTSGPSDEIPPPIADHNAIAFVRPGPDQSAVINARVVGKAMPAATPPSSRATINTSTVGAVEAMTDAGTDSAIPSTSIILRPYRSPSAPR